MALNLDFVTAIISFIFTLLILSYLIGDNPLFRVAVYIFIGVSAGYAAAVAWHAVLQPKLFEPLISGSWSDRLLAFIPLLLGVLLLMKLSPHTTRLGNPSLAFLVGAGAAVVIGGAVLGTLFPQILASISLFDLKALRAENNLSESLLEGSIILVGTLSTLAYFHFSTSATSGNRRGNLLVRILGKIGHVFIAITFGVLFAGVCLASMTALVERLNFLKTFIASLF
jgi:hypothetical protein